MQRGRGRPGDEAIDQQIGENDALSLVNGLSFLNPSQQCSETIMPFLCLYIFSLCDSSNTLHTILRQDCLDIRDDVCAREWSQAVAFLGGGVLPVCDEDPPRCYRKLHWQKL